MPQRTVRTVFASAAAAVAVCLGGCALWRPTTVPLRTIAVAAQCAGAVDTLVVMLPGSYSLPEDYLREDFIQAARSEGLAVDWLLVDAHVGYYRERSIIDRLHDDVVVPARARGYRHLWFAGISIGGFGAMLYADAHPDDVDGVVAIAPYLGSRRYAEQIGAATTRPLFLGYGSDDPFAANDAILADALPPVRVYTAPGGHDWTVWRVLWQRMLPALPLPRDAACAGGRSESAEVPAAACAAGPAR